MNSQSNPGTPKQIQQVHGLKLANEGMLYYETTGKIYRGQKGGYLKEEKNLINVENDTLINTEHITDNTFRITSLENRVTNVESTKADKCLVIAMGIVL